MTWLQEWTRSIIVLVIFAGFLELLLPSGNMKSTTQVLVGLFVLTLLLNPIVAIVEHTRHGLEISLPSGSGVEVATAIAQGELLKEQQMEYVISDYKKNIEHQILSLLELKAGLSKADIKVDVIADSSQADFGRISSLQVNVNNESANEMLTDAQTLTSLLADFYGLTKDKVVVIIDS